MSFKLTIGKVARVGVRCFHNEAIISLRPTEPELADYLFRFLPIFAALQTSNNAIKGSTLNKGLLTLLPIALPPLAEQKRIVIKVDELMAICDRLEEQKDEREALSAALARASVARFAHAPTPANVHLLFNDSYSISAADLRKTILTLAIQGKLVSQRTGEDTEAQRRSAKEAKSAANGTSQGAWISDNISDRPFEIPGTWSWVCIGDAIRMINGRAFKANEWSGPGLPIVRIQNLNNEAAAFNYFDGDFDPKHKIGSGSFLISWSGTPGTSFGAFIWDRGDALLNQHIFKCELYGNAFEKKYLALAINARLDEMISHAQGGVGLRHITKGKLESIGIPLPPLTEQRQIVAKVDQLMVLVDQLELKLAASRATAANLLDAVVVELTAREETP
jgi:restriction endonuclease S subunit